MPEITQLGNLRVLTKLELEDYIPGSSGLVRDCAEYCYLNLTNNPKAKALLEHPRYELEVRLTLRVPPSHNHADRDSGRAEEDPQALQARP